jgi:hypothetical protein
MNSPGRHALALAALLLAALAALAGARLIPAESGDVFYRAAPGSVGAVGADGRELWSQGAVYPLIAADRAGRCIAVANRPYVYDVRVWRHEAQVSAPVQLRLSDELVSALRQYGVQLPQTVTVVMNLSLPLPPVVFASVYKTSVLSLHAPNGYPLWALNLGPCANVTALATDCDRVAAGTAAGDVYVVRGGAVEAAVRLGSPVTAVAVGAGAVYAGTEDGGIYAVTASGATKIAECGGAVYGLYVGAGGMPVALCFEKRERPRLRVYPHGITLQDPVLVAYSTDAPRLAFAASQDGRWLFVGTASEVVAIRDGAIAWRRPLPAPPTAVASSWNGSVVAVGTLAGHLLVFRDGVPVLRTDPISAYLLARNATAVGEAARAVRPVTSVAVSFDGRVIAVETWDSVRVVLTARVPYAVEAPDECLPAEAAVIAGDAAYLYALERSGALYAPYGRVSVRPLHKYLDGARCRPLQNITLEVFGDVLEPVRIRYVKEYRVSLSPPGLVRGPEWASGAITVYAQTPVPVQTSGPAQARLALAGWRVNGRPLNLTLPALTVSVAGPTAVEALYRVEAPEYVQLDEGSRLRLDHVVVLDASGRPVASGRSPVISAYPVTVVASYVRQFRASTRWPARVNGSQSVWADAGSRLVFEAPDVDLGNGTRLSFRRWAETGERSPVVVVAADAPVSLTPVYAVEYRVWARPPARVVEPPNATWVERGALVRVAAPQVLEEAGGVRVVVDRWAVNGKVNASLAGPSIAVRARGPLNLTFTTKRQYLVTLVSRYGSVPSQLWADEGTALYVTPVPQDVWSPPPLHWVFSGWRDVSTGAVARAPVITRPAAYEAAWSLDPVPLAAVGGAAGAAVALAWLRKKRRLRPVAEEELA